MLDPVDQRVVDSAGEREEELFVYLPGDEDYEIKDTTTNYECHTATHHHNNIVRVFGMQRSVTRQLKRNIKEMIGRQ